MSDPRRRKTWNDFYNEVPRKGPSLPLGTGETIQSDQQHNFLGVDLELVAPESSMPSSIMPSAEAHFFDNNQSHLRRGEDRIFALQDPPSGINQPWPYPNRRVATNTPGFAYLSGYKPTDFQDMFSYYEVGGFPTGWWAVSGILKTYSPDISGYTRGNPAANNRESGVFHWNGELDPNVTQPSEPPFIYKGSLFSNGERAKSNQIKDFDIFNDYVHHHFINKEPIKIPYISTYKVSIDWNAYG
jgi:hypothetical protein|tara:strand:- start:180 stop:908 length:729 start_codon:yes stop_codon:yes gene_type:complete